MFSAEGEMVPLSEPLYPKGNVEDWLLEVERVMMDSIRKILGQSLLSYPEVRVSFQISFSLYWAQLMLTRIRVPAKLPCHKVNLWRVSCSFLLSRKLLSKIDIVPWRFHRNLKFCIYLFMLHWCKKNLFFLPPPLFHRDFNNFFLF